MHFAIQQITKAIFFHVVIILLIAGCEDKDDSVNYRSLYLGNFSFSSYSYTWELEWGYTYGDTIEFEGSIEPDVEQDSVIIINYRPIGSDGWTCNGIKVYGSQIRPLIKINGELGYPYIFETCGHHSIFSGSFSDPDSLSFHVGGGGLGGTWGHHVTGIRIK